MNKGSLDGAQRGDLGVPAISSCSTTRLRLGQEVGLRVEATLQPGRPIVVELETLYGVPLLLYLPRTALSGSRSSLHAVAAILAACKPFR